MGKDISYSKQLEMQFWCDTYVAVASSSNCVDKKTPKIWADIALDEFRNKFANQLDDSLKSI